MNNDQIDEVIEAAEQIAAGKYNTHEVTARNHAKIQSLLVKTNGELIKTIRRLDAKNIRLQKQIAVLTVVATVATIIALFR